MILRLMSPVETIIEVIVPGKPWTKEEVELLVAEYETNPRIYNMLNRSYQAINYKAHSLGLKKKQRGNYPSLDVSYFDKWSDTMAWILGFLVADGNILRKTYGEYTTCRISFIQSDKDVLIKIASELGIPDSAIHSRKTYSIMGVKYDVPKISYALSFTSGRIYDRLIELGVCEAKSTQIKKIKVPKQFFLSFLLGYFDGDGCFSWSTKPRQRTPRLSFTAGSRQWLKWLEARIGKYYDMPGGRIRKNTAWRLTYRKAASIKLMGLMYSTSNTKIRLERKYENFMNYLNYQGIDLSALETPEAKYEYFNNLVKI